jgi:hypothetical protein
LIQLSIKEAFASLPFFPSPARCQAASLLLDLLRIRDASVIRRHGQNHGRFIQGNRPTTMWVIESLTGALPNWRPLNI